MSWLSQEILGGSVVWAARWWNTLAPLLTRARGAIQLRSLYVVVARNACD
jgi:hypothetical protein